jgi:hypothetical protein
MNEMNTATENTTTKSRSDYYRDVKWACGPGVAPLYDLPAEAVQIPVHGDYSRTQSIWLIGADPGYTPVCYRYFPTDRNRSDDTSRAEIWLVPSPGTRIYYTYRHTLSGCGGRTVTNTCPAEQRRTADGGYVRDLAQPEPGERAVLVQMHELLCRCVSMDLARSLEATRRAIAQLEAGTGCVPILARTVLEHDSGAETFLGQLRDQARFRQAQIATLWVGAPSEISEVLSGCLRC